MVRGAAVFAVALPARGFAPGDFVFHPRSGGGCGDAGDCAGDEHRIPRDAAGSIAGGYRARFPDASRLRVSATTMRWPQNSRRFPECAPSPRRSIRRCCLSFGGEARGVVAKGVEPERERRGDEALQHIVAGNLDFTPDADGIDALIVGKQLADEWKMVPGDYVTLTSPQGRLTPFGLIPRTRRFRVAGVFDSGFYDYDKNWCFLTMHAAQSLSGATDVVNVLEFRLRQS